MKVINSVLDSSRACVAFEAYLSAQFHPHYFYRDVLAKPPERRSVPTRGWTPASTTLFIRVNVSICSFSRSSFNLRWSLELVFHCHFPRLPIGSIGKHANVSQSFDCFTLLASPRTRISRCVYRNLYLNVSASKLLQQSPCETVWWLLFSMAIRNRFMRWLSHAFVRSDLYVLVQSASMPLAVRCKDGYLFCVFVQFTL